MKRPRTPAELFGLSFLDVLACGFGAAVLLLLISRPGWMEGGGAQQAPPQAATRAERAQVESLRAELQALLEDAAAHADTQGTDPAPALAAAEQRLEALERDNQGLELAKESLERASIRARTPVQERSPEVGGIPVDSAYVIFILDTSGSMKSIWGRVIETVGRVLEIHPKVRGFQVLNDNGTHLIKGYKGKWIPDTPRRRRSVLELARNWGAFSNSSPVEGLETALRIYGDKPGNTAVYIFGDDYTGASYDQVISTLRRLNTDRMDAQARRVRVHAVGFISSANTERYATLMREATRRNEGVFLGLPIQDDFGNTGVPQPDYKTRRR